MDILLNGMISSLLAFGGLLSYETLRVKLINRNWLLYVLLVILPFLAYLAIASASVWALFFAGLFPATLLVICRGDAVRRWIAERYDRVISDIPFFDDQNGKFRSIVLVVTMYWCIVGFFLAESARA